MPRDYSKAMHLPPDVPRSYLRCYVCQVAGKPAFLFWSHYAETAMLVVDY
jgi:hypothetical protein